MKIALLVAVLVSAGCASDPNLGDACQHLCRCEPTQLPSLIDRCVTECRAEATGEDVPPDFIDCLLALSCEELLAGGLDICEPVDDVAQGDG